MSISNEPGKTKLEEYTYTALESPNALRLLRLRPASDENHDIDAELAEFELPEHNRSAGDASIDGQAKKGKDGKSSHHYSPTHSKTLPKATKLTIFILQLFDNDNLNIYK
jgi:hypothetical protein